MEKRLKIPLAFITRLVEWNPPFSFCAEQYTIPLAPPPPVRVWEMKKIRLQGFFFIRGTILQFDISTKVVNAACSILRFAFCVKRWFGKVLLTTKLWVWWFGVLDGTVSV